MGAAVMVFLNLPVFLMGRAVGRKMKVRTCSCGDGFGQHLKNGQCQAEHLVKYNSVGSKQLRRCKCVRYDGPRPDLSVEEAMAVVGRWSPPKP